MAEYAEGNLSPGELGRRGQEADKRRTRVAYLPVDLGGGLGVLGAYYISLREKSFDVQDLATTHDTLHTHTHTHPLITKTVTCLSRRPLKKKSAHPCVWHRDSVPVRLVQPIVVRTRLCRREARLSFSSRPSFAKCLGGCAKMRGGVGVGKTSRLATKRCVPMRCFLNFYLFVGRTNRLRLFLVVVTTCIHTYMLECGFLWRTARVLHSAHVPRGEKRERGEEKKEEKKKAPVWTLDSRKEIPLLGLLLVVRTEKTLERYAC